MTHNVTLYPAPAGIAPSDRYTVTVNGVESFTYLTTGRPRRITLQGTWRHGRRST